MLETDEGSDEKAITAMGLLNTIETLLSVMEEQPEIMGQLQPIVLGVIGHIFTNSVMGELDKSNISQVSFILFHIADFHKLLLKMNPLKTNFQSIRSYAIIFKFFSFHIFIKCSSNFICK